MVMDNKIIADYVFYHVYGTFDIDELNVMETAEEFVDMCVKKFCNLMKDFDTRFSDYLNDNIIANYLVDVLHLNIRGKGYSEELQDTLFGKISEQTKLMMFAFAFIDTISEDDVAADFIKDTIYKKFEGFTKMFIKALHNEFNKNKVEEK